ncbi:hypothetical protein ACIPQJ_01655 [Streptomyces sp. NPDC090082]|uniref:hypothetical protein n=1 Tax=unclassified Streptomyces TaxID=2593676 RepID=UPI00381D2C09
MVELYEPRFQHKDWIDNQDRVQAGGDNGLNDRFHRLEDEFSGLARNQINPIIRNLTKPVMHLTLVPVLTPSPDPNAGGAPRPAWSQAADMVEKPSGQTEAHGFMSIVLPDGVKVTSLLMTGRIPNSSQAAVRAVLKSREINNSGGSVTLLTASKLGEAAPSQGLEITNDRQRYFLLLDVTGADVNESVAVFCVQLTYE